MYQKLNTKNKILTFVTIALIIFISALISSIYFDEKDKLLLNEKKYFQTATSSYSNILKDHDNYYKYRLKNLINTDDVIDAIRTKDRIKLHSLLLKDWNILKDENKDLKILHFHLPNGRTLLRMHRPDKFGDNIAKDRAMIANVYKYKKFTAGYEAGKNLLGYRVILPIFYNGKYIGAVEFGSKPDAILKKMKQINNISGLVFSKDAVIFKHKNNNIKFQDYTLQYSTLNDEKLISKIPKDYKLNKYITIKHNEKVYALYYFNHIDFSGVKSAKTILFNDITTIYNEFNSSLKKLLIFSLFLFIIFLLTIKFGFEKLLNNIDKTNIQLNKHIAFLNSYETAMNESSIVSRSDLTGKITYVNDKFCEISGYKREDILGKQHSILRDPNTPKSTFEDLWNTIQSKQAWQGVLHNIGKTNNYWVDISIVPILDEKNNISEYIAVRHDITTIKNQQEELDNILKTDYLTGFGNRYKLNQDTKKSKNPALAILNIDNFSQVNDFYGHIVGDDIIKKLAIIINNTIEKYNYELYHLQGDEYVILNSNALRVEFYNNILALGKEISNTSINIGDQSIFLNISIAISYESNDKLLTTADMALRVAKKENKDILIYSDEISLNNEYENNIKWTKKIKKAIEEDKIVPVFQPIVNNHNAKWEKYEALVRLVDDEGKLISPYFFLEISKKTKYYTTITKIMIKKSFDMFKDKDLDFSVNLTIDDIKNEDIKEYIFDMLVSYNIGHKVVFEIVESESIEDFEEVAKFISTVKNYGCKIAIDDFGTGYSNFEYLLKLKADFIKIDGSMIKDIDTNRDAQLVVATIVNFAKSLNIKTIAEFVENESVLAKVKELGIDYSQGYHFSKPELSL